MTLAHILTKRTTISPVWMTLLAGCGSIAALIISARVQVPMIPVPITFQTAVILALPCLLGVRMALGTLGSYFALGAMGLPVFAMTAGALPGAAYFAGPTGGYLAGFVLAMMMVGGVYHFLKTRASSRGDFLTLFALMLAGHGVILAAGMAWLAFGPTHMGAAAAFTAGVVPFIAGSLLKSGIAASVVGYFLAK